MSSCNNVIQEILEQHTLTNAQYPVLLWSSANCDGIQYPPDGEFNLWEQYLDLSTLNMSRINSYFIAHHALLELWSNNSSYYSLAGPTSSSNTAGQLAFWGHYDGSPCLTGELDCGTPVQWTFGDNDGEIQRMRISRPIVWTNMLHQRANNKQAVTYQNVTYGIDNDTLFEGICGPDNVNFTCNCWDAYTTLQVDHPQSVNESFVNIQPNTCNADIYYMPSEALVGAGTAFECSQMINSQLYYGTFKTVSQGGPQFYVCSGQAYVNSYSYDSPNPDPLARLDDSEDDMIELKEMSSGFPVYAYYVIAGILVMALLLFVFYVLERQKGFSFAMRQKIRHVKNPVFL